MGSVGSHVARTLWLALVMALWSGCCLPASIVEAPSGEVTRKGKLEVVVDSAGEPRSAWVKVPDGMDLSKKNPVIMVFHGGGANDGKTMVPYFSEHKNSDFILVFPNGQRQDESVGGWRVQTVTDMRHVDFIEALRTRLITDYNADAGRIYAAGFSGGAHLVHQLYCEKSKHYAGFVAMNHYLKAEHQGTCKPDPVVPYMLVAGTADDGARWDGEMNPETGKRHELGAEETMRWWRQTGGCGDVTPKKRPDKGDKTTVLHYRYEDCKRVSAMEFMKIKGGGHSMPGRRGKGPTQCRDIEMADEIIAFFRRTGGL